MMGCEGSEVGPSYLAPGMTERGRAGIVGNLRWFHPSYRDTAVFLWIFLIGTGWNLSTALALDVSDEESWYQPHPHSEGVAVMHAFKNRADRHQFALSMTKPKWHPYKIVRYMIERTKVLRATVRHELAKAQEKYRLDPTPENNAAVAELNTRTRSLWLYHVMNKTGEVSSFNHQDSRHLNFLVRMVAQSHGLAEEHPTLMSMSTSTARDAWIGHAYVQSGYSVLLTRLASQHATLRMLKHYLRSTRYRARSEGEVRKVQDAIFTEISSGRIVDPTRLRVLVRNGTISKDQERRLLDLRQRTRLGMGCIDPTAPPPEIAPDHNAGTLCRVAEQASMLLKLVEQAIDEHKRPIPLVLDDETKNEAVEIILARGSTEPLDEFDKLIDRIKSYGANPSDRLVTVLGRLRELRLISAINKK